MDSTDNPGHEAVLSDEDRRKLAKELLQQGQQNNVKVMNMTGLSKDAVRWYVNSVVGKLHCISNSKQILIGLKRGF